MILGLGSSEEGYRQDLLRIDEGERKLMNGRRPDWRVRFAFYGDKNEQGSIGHGKHWLEEEGGAFSMQEGLEP